MPFVATLAAWVMKTYGQEAANLTHVRLLVPNRRSARTLRDAFLEQSGGRPVLLPRIAPLGDLENDPLEVGDLFPPQEIAPISDTRRHMLLTRLVERYETKRSGHRCSMVHAARLAEQLMKLLDEVHRQGVSMDALETLAPEHLSGHWLETVDFLRIISQRWPEVLEQENVVEPAIYRREKLRAIAEAWKKQKPQTPIIAAGSTGSHAAIANLLSVIARLPQGMVVLPGFDTGMDEASWQQLSFTHPQFGMKQLIGQMDVRREDVACLSAQATLSPTQICLRGVFAPAESTSTWRKSAFPLQEGLAHLHICETDTPLDEARVIAVMLREALDTPGKTAALVTPDRALARMVSAQMQRFGIAIDDSAGMPLLSTPAAMFMRLVLECAQSEAAPVALLALLNHPLAACGIEPERCRAMARELDILLLRGIRHVPGLGALCDDAKPYPALQHFLQGLRAPYEEFTSHLTRNNLVSFSTLLDAHIAFAQHIAATGDIAGEKRLWKGDAAGQLSERLADIAAHAGELGNIDPTDYAELLEAMLSGDAYRPRYGLHPRLHILSPMEARMQQFDRVVLAGLNEGSWPALPAADPWMSRPMRTAFGLEPPEQSIGHSAHDFYMLCHAPEVILTRPRKSQGSPAVASRWLTRLRTLVQGHDETFARAMDLSAHYDAAKKILEAPASLPPLACPAPSPPVSARPSQMRVTTIDWWVRDPYMVYARYILGLSRLKPLDEDPGAADLGIIIHAILEKFVGEYPQSLPANAYDRLIDIGREVFAPYRSRPAITVLWWPRFEAMARWFIDQEVGIRQHTQHVYAERNGRLLFKTKGMDFTLTTRIDRIECNSDGSITIADYKTGALPADKDIHGGLANQLALEALVARDGELTPPIPVGGITPQLCYWKLSGGAKGPEIHHVSVDIDDARNRLLDLIEQYSHSDTPYRAQANHALLPRHNDYRHLTRRQEWEAI